jgi:hypothetical protein
VIAFSISEFSTAQTKMIRGTVRDSATLAPLQNVSITLKNSLQGGVTDSAGRFSILVDNAVTVINFSITGYRTATRMLSDEPTQEFALLLTKSYTTLEEVFVNAKKGKYRNKDNPAVELIRQVIANRSRNGPEANPYVSFKEYERTQMFTDSSWIKMSNNFL